jgi:hypothetical protein
MHLRKTCRTKIDAEEFDEEEFDAEAERIIRIMPKTDIYETL